MSRHNLSAASATSLTLSEETRLAGNGWAPARRCARCGAELSETVRQDARYCSTRCRVAAHRAERAGRPISTIAPSLGRISGAGDVDSRADNRESTARGDELFSYSHAAAIRAGFRGAGREAPGIAYRSRGWYAGRRNGWSTRSLRVLEGGAVRVARSAS
jgi:hypothetical protein